MAQVYFMMIQMGKRTIEEVPARLRSEVQVLLDEHEAELNA